MPERIDHIDENTKLVLANFGDGFEVIQNGDGSDIEIIKDGESFEMLCARNTHPYCNLAEDRFLETVNSSSHRKEIDEGVIITYLRNKRTLKTETAKTKVSLSKKNIGVRSSIVTHPPELAGLMCAPGEEPNHWIVFRPFNMDYLDPDLFKLNQTLAGLDLAPHFSNLPKIEIQAVPTTQTELPEIEIKELAPKGIISSHEQRLFKTVKGIYLEETQTPEFKIKVLATPGNPKKFKLDIEGVQEIPNSDERLFIFGSSSHQWPEMPDQKKHFTDTHPSSHGYRELIAGHIISEEGKYYFITEEPPTSLEGLKSGIHRLKNVAHDIRREVQGSVHQNN